MNRKHDDIIVIPSIGDPRNTLTSIAMFQNAFNINPPMPVVVLYGNCPSGLNPSPEFRPRGEEGSCVDDWKPRWDEDRFEEFRERFRQVADFNGVPVIFFDNVTQRRIWKSLRARAEPEKAPLLGGIDKEGFIKCVDDIFSATYSYGAQRNKAFIAARILGAQRVFFFDDDTYLAPHVGNMIERHKQLLQNKNVYAVTGGYFGQRVFNASIFRRIEQQQEFTGLLASEIPDDQATQDLWGWRMTDGVLGGNFCVNKEVYENICCPSMYRTPTTDDKFIGREILRTSRRQARVYKTGWPVVHIHYPGRMNLDEVSKYLRSWAKTKAFWAIYDNMQEDAGEWVIDDKGRSVARASVDEFGKSLQNLANIEETEASGALANAIPDAAEAIIGDAENMVEMVTEETQSFLLLKRCWESILDATGQPGDIFEDGRSSFGVDWEDITRQST